jgi:hypothetical protein
MKYLGLEKLHEVRELYLKLEASDRVAKIMSYYEGYDKKMKAEALKIINELTEKQGLRSIIRYLPFSFCRLNFISPTPKKEEQLMTFSQIILPI